MITFSKYSAWDLGYGCEHSARVTPDHPRFENPFTATSPEWGEVMNAWNAGHDAALESVGRSANPFPPRQGDVPE